MAEALHILVIDDSEDDRLLYRRSLKSSDVSYSITEAADGTEGLACIQARAPSCILLDYSLPGHNGVEVLKFIRSGHPFIPVVMLTGQGNETVAVAAIQEGAQNYIAKSSITPDALQRVISTAIEHCNLQKRIHEQRASLEIFTHALAHDLKEPVRTIRSYLELLEQEDFSEKTKHYFRHIEKSAERMATLIETVYFYTRLESPDQMKREVCDVSMVLDEVQESLNQLIKERGTEITCGPMPVVSASRGQLLQLLQNLCANAIGHSPTPVRIHITAAERAETWLFRVQDNGPGISREYHEKIFQPFKRVAHHNEQGSGLGLAICQKIVEGHGGKIWCESAQGAGTLFFFTLPKALPTTTAPPSAPEAVTSVAKPPVPQEEKKLANLLLVEDNEADIDLARIMLIERGKLQCNLLVAMDGEEALARLHDTRVDLVLLDLNMPGMDGFEVLQHMQQDAALERTAVVICTTSTYDRDRDKANALGVAGYITKPAGVEQLKSAIGGINTLRLTAESGGYALLRAS